MYSTTEFLRAIATLLWPIILIVVLILFNKQIIKIMESIRTRKWSLKIGGQELTVEELGTQQQNFIADLQRQLVELQQYVHRKLPDVVGHRVDESEYEDAEKFKHSVKRVLWVDDTPKNNQYFVDLLKSSEVSVDLALTTGEGIRMFEKKKYGLVISDMGRFEGTQYRKEAGIELLKKIKSKNKEIPFIIYCSPEGYRNIREKPFRTEFESLPHHPPC